MAQPASTGFVFKGSMDKYASLEGQKRESPAAERNKQPILDVLLEYLPRGAAAAAATGLRGCRPLILEIASGSGQHAAHVAAALPEYDIQPSDVTSELYGSIAAYAAGLPNVRLPPLLLDASAADDWPTAVAATATAAAAAPPPADGRQPICGATENEGTGGLGDNGGNCEGGQFLGVAALLCVNLCHISPLAATRGLLRGAGSALRPGGGLLFLYGPFTRDRRHTTDSNAAFDASLRARNPEWGYRDVADVEAWASEAGLEALEVREMPANNFMLVFRRKP